MDKFNIEELPEEEEIRPHTYFLAHLNTGLSADYAVLGIYKHKVYRWDIHKGSWELDVV